MNIKKHKAGPILFNVAVIVTFLAYGLLFYFCSIGIKNILLKEKVFELFNEEVWAIDIVKIFGGYASIIILIISFISIIWCLYSYNITALAYDVPVTENQFKELLDFEVECAKKLGLKEIPKMYIDTYSYGEEEVVNINGARFDNKHVLRIDAQDIYNSAEEGYYAAKFTIAKKLVSIYFGYQDLFIIIITLCSKWIPVLSQLRNRISCYDCDKGAVALLGEEMSIKAIVIKSTGYYLMPYLNVEDYLLSQEKVIDKKNIILENLMSDIPLTTYRLEAINEKIDGRLF